MSIAMAFFVPSFGAEMLSILVHRMQETRVSATKIDQVISDFISAIFSPEFVSEICTPQEIYPWTHLRSLFEKITANSVVRLSAPSMDKLLDLAFMGLKFQVLRACSCPEEILQILLRHLADLRRICQPSDRGTLAEYCSHLEICTHNWRLSDWRNIRIILLGYLQSKRVRVAAFLRSGLQDDSGALLCGKGGRLAPGINDQVGKVVWGAERKSACMLDVFAGSEWRETEAAVPISRPDFINIYGDLGRPIILAADEAERKPVEISAQPIPKSVVGLDDFAASLKTGRDIVPDGSNGLSSLISKLKKRADAQSVDLEVVEAEWVRPKDMFVGDKIPPDEPKTITGQDVLDMMDSLGL